MTCWIRTCVSLCLFSALGGAVAADGDSGSYTVSDPTIKGGGTVITIKVTVPNVIPPHQKTDTNSIPVPLKGGVKAGGKAGAIVNAINAFYGCVCASIDKSDGTKINIASTSTNLGGRSAAGTIAITSEGTQGNATEPDLKAALSNAPGNPFQRPQVLIGFVGKPTGVDAGGAVSSFSADFGYDGLDASATVRFDELGSPTIDGILGAVYAQLLADLPLSMKPDLSLNLADQMIHFELPTDQTNYFVDVHSTDFGDGSTGVGTLGGFAMEIPEPRSLLFCLAGLCAVGWGLHGSRSRHRRGVVEFTDS